MARRRMFSLDVVDTDKFSEMPLSAQALYFHLGMHGDDDGFVDSPKKIQRAIGACDDDMRLLAAKGFIIPFISGVVVISDWKLNNTLKNDRYRSTIYQGEKALLREGKAGQYVLDSNMDPKCFQNGSKTEPQHNITEHMGINPLIRDLSPNNQALNSNNTPARLDGRPPVDEFYDKSWMQEGGGGV